MLDLYPESDAPKVVVRKLRIKRVAVRSYPPTPAQGAVPGKMLAELVRTHPPTGPPR